MVFTRRSRNGILLALLSIGFGFTTARGAQSESPRATGAVLQGNAIKRVQPAYPPLAKAAKVSGSVVVEVTLDEEGNVIAARAVTGHPLLKDSAVTAARGWKFKPTTLDGTAVKVIGTLTFNFNLGNPREIELLVKLVAENPGSAELQHQLGMAYLENAEPGKAIEPLNQAIRIDPGFVKAYFALGNAYSRAEMTELAIQAYREATRIKPDFGEAYFYLGMLYWREDRHQEAVDAFKQATKINDRMHMAFVGMGRSLKELNRLNEALEAFKQAAGIEPDSIDAHIELGETYSKLGDKEAALAEYAIIRKLAPGFAPQMLERIKKDE